MISYLKTTYRMLSWRNKGSHCRLEGFMEEVTLEQLPEG